MFFRLSPYFENLGKRVIKSPKLYFNDVGLASYLLGIQNEIQLNRDPLRGNLFENAIILELKKYRLNHGLDPFLFYYRDIQKNEIDIIYKNGHDLIPIEIKSSKTYHSEFIKKLRYFHSIAKERVPRSFLIYAGDLEQRINTTYILNFKHAIQAIE